MTAFMVILALALACSEAHADIFRYLNDEEVVCFTDAPTTRTAVRVVKERKVPRRSGTKKTAPAASPAPSSPEKMHHGPDGEADSGGEACHDLPVAGRISSPVGFRHDPIDGMLREHKGVDIATPEGTPVRPVAAGTVIFSGYRQGYGNTVVVEHDDGTVTLYAHHSVNLKSAGEPVDRGSTIAFSGSTGRSTGPHLHFEAWKDGVNMTASYIPGAASGGNRQVAANIRRFVQADGTLVFTNLP